VLDLTSKAVELYNEVGHRGDADNLWEYHVRLLRIDIQSPGRLGLYLTIYIYHFTDIEWADATEENGYRPERRSRVRILRSGSDTQHIRKAIAYVDAFTGLKEGK
jgi:hypothetical protein